MGDWRDAVVLWDYVGLGGADHGEGVAGWLVLFWIGCVFWEWQRLLAWVAEAPSVLVRVVRPPPVLVQGVLVMAPSVLGQGRLVG